MIVFINDLLFPFQILRNISSDEFKRRREAWEDNGGFGLDWKPDGEHTTGKTIIIQILLKTLFSDVA